MDLRCDNYIMESMTEKYKEKISGELGCFDRVLIKGTLQGVSYDDGMGMFLRQKNIPIFSYLEFAKTIQRRVIKNAESLASSHGIEINYVNKKGISKEDIAAAALQEKKDKMDGEVHGLFCIISAVERCPSFYPDREKNGQFVLKFRERQCLHYYFYIMDQTMGLCYLRVPTWLPLRLQFYFNGHNWLANKLDQSNIKYAMLDNAFVDIADFPRAQQIVDEFSAKELHRKLDQLALVYCPEHQDFERSYHWTFMQAEYATDIIFRRQKDLQMIYPNLISTAIHTVKPENIATFLGRKVSGNFKGEAGNNYNVRREGSRIKHTMKTTSIKMYDKFQQILRIEATTNNIAFFKHYRKVEHKDGSSSMDFTSMKKSIYSLGALMKVMKAANLRYLEFISAIEDNSAGLKRLDKVSKRAEMNNRGYKGINFFDENDLKLMQTLNRGEFNIAGFRNKDIRQYLTDKTSGQVSRLLKRLKIHGLIKKATNSYKYHLTKLGRRVTIAGMKIREMVIIPALNY